jgi:hypothetical protein
MLQCNQRIFAQVLVLWRKGCASPYSEVKSASVTGAAMKRAVILLCLGLASCVSASFNKSLGPYRGQPASALIAKLGIPTDEKTVAGRKLYVWAPTPHLVVNQYGGGQYYCTIRAAVDANDIITSVDYEGNLGGCGDYMTRLGDPLGLGLGN